MKTSLIWATPDAEKHLAFCARVSSPNQDNPFIDKLLQYCLKHGHWSVFEMASMCVEIHTNRAISAQLLRHKSFSFQEHSQRYSNKIDFDIIFPRRQDVKNRQNSIDDLPTKTKFWWAHAVASSRQIATYLYEEATRLGISKETARFILPLNVRTKMYMCGNLRSWMTYFKTRCSEDTQLEHRVIANEIKDIFKKEFPIIGSLLDE
jgi:thymidylate synthase (FAD)